MSDGTDLRGEFLLDPSVTFLNHGSFGACPRAVFERYQEWQLELERQPVLFLVRRMEELLGDARAALGAYVERIRTTSCSSPTQPAASISWRAHSASGRTTKSCRPTSSTAPSTWPGSTSAPIAARGTLRTPIRLPVTSAEEVVDGIWAGVGPRTRVLFVSHHTSSTALTLPVAELCGRAREAGIRTVVDGAHVPGHLPLDLRALDVDYYAGNCHKWLCAPKGAGFLYVRRELQRHIHPLVISWGYEGDDPSFLSRHEKQGTRDPSAYLTVPAAIQWQTEHDWDAVRKRCHELARRARNELGLEPVAPDSPDFFRQMVTLRLPADAPENLQERLYDEHRIEIPVSEHAGGRLIRPSFQGYNDAGDLERLKAALTALL